MLISLIGAYPAKSLASDYASFNLSSSRLLVEDVEFLSRQTQYQGQEIEILKEKETVLSLAYQDMEELNKSYRAMVDDLGKTINLYDEKIIAASERADKWKAGAVRCNKALTELQVVPFYKSKRFLIPLAFIAGAYAGTQVTH